MLASTSWHVAALSFMLIWRSGCDAPSVRLIWQATTAGHFTSVDTAVADQTSAQDDAPESGSLVGIAHSPPVTGRHALLIGNSNYDYLEEWFQLQGPANDVVLFRQLLIERFEYDPAVDDMVTLAAANESNHRPNRANIEREFLRLGETVQSGDAVVILMGGRGSQQPDNDADNPLDTEPDGRDDIFLPCDVKKWSGKLGTVENAIVDDESRIWLSKIVGRGAFVWLIMDASHSGSGVRGSESEISRQIPPGKLIPEEAFFNVKSASEDDSRTGVESSLFSPAGEGGIVASYAAQPIETTPERKLPLDSDTANYYGLLTFTICEILTNANRNLTYHELVQACEYNNVSTSDNLPECGRCELVYKDFGQQRLHVAVDL